MRKMNRIPRPLYAAAGAGDLAYEKIRSLPGKALQARGKVAELRPVVEDRMRKADLARLRGAARRNAETVVRGAHIAQDRATIVYSELVDRGERVVRTARSESAATSGEDAVVEVSEADPALDVEPTKDKTAE